MHSAYIDFFSLNVHKVILGCLIDNIYCFGVWEVDGEICIASTLIVKCTLCFVL